MFKCLKILVLIAAALPALLPALADDKPREKIRVILIDGQNNHNWRVTTPLMKKELEHCGRFSVDVSSNLSLQEKGKGPSPMTNVPFPPDLSKYDVLVSNYNGAPWPTEFKKELQDRLREGKIGLVIVHSANNCFEDWTEYNRMIGMGWRKSNFGDHLTIDAEGKEVRVPKGKGPGASHGAYHPFLITVRDPQHPITRGMPREWLHADDELYSGMRGPIENVHLLATTYDDKSKDQRGTGEHEPMMWTVTYGKGRVFHTPMGHDERSMRCLGFVATLQRGSEWAATGQVSLPLRKDFPTAVKASSLPAK